MRRMRFLSGTSSSLSRSSVSRQWLDSGTAMSVFEIFVADLYVLKPFFPFIFEPLAARSYLSALAVSFKRQPPLGMEEEAHWAHA